MTKAADNLCARWERVSDGHQNRGAQPMELFRKVAQRAQRMLEADPRPFISKVESGERRLDFVELQVVVRLHKCQLAYFEDEMSAR